MQKNAVWPCGDFRMKRYLFLIFGVLLAANNGCFGGLENLGLKFHGPVPVEGGTVTLEHTVGPDDPFTTEVTLLLRPASGGNPRPLTGQETTNFLMTNKGMAEEIIKNLYYRAEEELSFQYGPGDFNLGQLESIAGFYQSYAPTYEVFTSYFSKQLSPPPPSPLPSPPPSSSSNGGPPPPGEGWASWLPTRKQTAIGGGAVALAAIAVLVWYYQDVIKDWYYGTNNASKERKKEAQKILAQLPAEQQKAVVQQSTQIVLADEKKKMAEKIEEKRELTESVQQQKALQKKVTPTALPQKRQRTVGRPTRKK